MNKPLDITNQTFGKLKVIKYAGRKNGNSYWTCRCECENVSDYFLGNLRRGERPTKCCKKCASKSRKTHGLSNTRTYTIWISLKKRHLLCEEWQNSFYLFFKEIGGSEIPGNKFLCRKDNTRLFNKNNFKISKNRGPSEKLLVHYNGEAHTLPKWAKKLKISRQALHMRLKKYPIHIALSFTNRWSTDENNKILKTNHKKIIIN